MFRTSRRQLLVWLGSARIVVSTAPGQAVAARDDDPADHPLERRSVEILRQLRTDLVGHNRHMRISRMLEADDDAYAAVTEFLDLISGEGEVDELHA